MDDPIELVVYLDYRSALNGRQISRTYHSTFAGAIELYISQGLAIDV